MPEIKIVTEVAGRVCALPIEVGASVGDAGAGFNGKRANTSRNFGHDLDVRHSTLRAAAAHVGIQDTCSGKGGRPIYFGGLLLWPQIA